MVWSPVTTAMNTIVQRLGHAEGGDGRRPAGGRAGHREACGSSHDADPHPRFAALAGLVARAGRRLWACSCWLVAARRRQPRTGARAQDRRRHRARPHGRRRRRARPAGSGTASARGRRSASRAADAGRSRRCASCGSRRRARGLHRRRRHGRPRAAAAPRARGEAALRPGPARCGAAARRTARRAPRGRAEIAVDARPDGGRSVAAPIEIDGAVRRASSCSRRDRRRRRAAAAPACGCWSRACVPVCSSCSRRAARGEPRGGARRCSRRCCSWRRSALPPGTARTLEPTRGGRPRAPLSTVTRAVRRAVARRRGWRGDERPLDLAAGTSTRSGRPLGLVATRRDVAEAQLAAALRRAAGAVTERCGGARVAVVALLLLLVVALGRRRAPLARCCSHRQAYAYVAPAHGRHARAGLLPVLLRHRAVVHRRRTSTTADAADHRDLGRAAQLPRTSSTDFAIAATTPDGRVFNYQNFYWTLGFTIVWTVDQRGHRRHRRAGPGADR